MFLCTSVCLCVWRQSRSGVRSAKSGAPNNSSVKARAKAEAEVQARATPRVMQARSALVLAAAAQPLAPQNIRSRPLRLLLLPLRLQLLLPPAPVQEVQRAAANPPVGADLASAGEVGAEVVIAPATAIDDAAAARDLSRSIAKSSLEIIWFQTLYVIAPA
jgi:hypothetical protein